MNRSLRFIAHDLELAAKNIDPDFVGMRWHWKLRSKSSCIKPGWFIGTFQATATRDLADLVKKEALSRTGERKHTRYLLK